jgi:hypothetical protein
MSRRGETAMRPSANAKGRKMIGHISLREQVDADFTYALRRAFARRVAARLLGNPSTSRAASSKEVAKASGARNKMRAGRKVVAVEKIVGSVGRSGDFDGTFLPIRRSLGERWMRVDRAFHLGVDLPEVVLYELGGRYFVVDGNHRVSVARFQGVRWIEAAVTHFHVGAPAAAPGLLDMGPRAKAREETMYPAAA